MYVDAHTHLDSYEDLLDPALEEVSQHGILSVSNSIDLPSYRRNLDIARRSELVIPTFGIHPWKAPKYVQRLDDLMSPAGDSPMLGEIGLDFHFIEDEEQYPAQREVFEFFLEAAREQEKTVILHTKGAEPEIVGLLDRHGISRAIIHWYSGGLATLDEMIARGFYFTVGMEISSSAHIRKIASRIPEDRLLTETDNPGGSQWLIGEMRMPSLVKEVVRDLGEVRGMSAEETAQLVWANFLDLTRTDPRLAGFLKPFT